MKSAARLPAWVLELRNDRHRANVALAADVADAVLSLGDENVPAPVRKRLVAMIERADQTGQGVPVSVAAKVLDVAEPTARSWIERGVLHVVHGSRPAAVTTRSLGEALAAATSIRRVGQDERLLRRMLEVLDDQRTRHEVVARIDELGSRVPLDPGRVAEELFA
jgi:hypothetical protein